MHSSARMSLHTRVRSWDGRGSNKTKKMRGTDLWLWLCTRGGGGDAQPKVFDVGGCVGAWADGSAREGGGGATLLLLEGTRMVWSAGWVHWCWDELAPPISWCLNCLMLVSVTLSSPSSLPQPSRSGGGGTSRLTSRRRSATIRTLQLLNSVRQGACIPLLNPFLPVLPSFHY